MTLAAKIIVGVIALIFLYVIVDSLRWVDKPQNTENKYKPPKNQQFYRVDILEEEKEYIKSKQTKKEQYKEYLQSDHWQNTRKKALARSGYKCQLCSALIHELNQNVI